MNKDQIKYLKKEAHQLRPIFQIGKEGISENLLEGLNLALVAHELIKVHILKNSPVTKKELIDVVTLNLDCDLIDQIGNRVVFYRKSDKNIYEL